jgi:hypothetical protein
MKFWNKRKEVRLRCWTRVDLHLRKHSPLLHEFAGWLTYREFDNLKRELQLNPSKNKFYMNLMKREIWFEDSKDAVWFSLTHSELLR